MAVPIPLPGVADVARRVRKRTVDSMGQELGTFTDETEPTASEVDAYIADAAGYVIARVGPTVADHLASAGRNVIALRAAMLVELGGKPEQSNDASGYRELRDLFREELAALLEGGRDVARPRYGTIAVRTPLSPVVAPAAAPVVAAP